MVVTIIMDNELQTERGLQCGTYWNKVMRIRVPFSLRALRKVEDAKVGTH